MKIKLSLKFVSLAQASVAFKHTKNYFTGNKIQKHIQ